MAKRRKRKVNLGSSASQHRKDRLERLNRAQSLIASLERSPGSCFHALEGIIDAERTLAIAGTHAYAIGDRGKKRDKSRYAHAALGDRLEKIESRFERECMAPVGVRR